MKTTITRRFEFAAAHQLLGLRDGHKCSRMHGHNYTVDAEVCGQVGPTGMVVDAEEIDATVGPVVVSLDHHTLNYFIPQPTAENIAAWILERCPMLTAVTVSENRRLSARVER